MADLASLLFAASLMAVLTFSAMMATYYYICKPIFCKIVKKKELEGLCGFRFCKEYKTCPYSNCWKNKDQ